MPLLEVFQAIEWHAEALELPDRTTYFIHPLCTLNQNVIDCQPHKIMEEVTDAIVLAVNEDVSQRWKGRGMSLWCIFEVSLAESFRLPWDIACETGAIATQRPFSNRKWECGSFDPDIAANLNSVAAECEKAKCLHFESYTRLQQ